MNPFLPQPGEKLPPQLGGQLALDSILPQHKDDIVPKAEVEFQHLGVDCERRLYLTLTISL